jgi:glycosyltransferase involved in cell wall biosynthesis
MRPGMPELSDGQCSQHRVLVVVPARNEERNVRAVVADVREHLPEADILVVDDASIDSTASVARGARALVAALPCNLGVGPAVQTGMRYALAHGYDVAVQVDGDGQHRGDEIRKIVSPVLSDLADIVIGSRFLGQVHPRPSQGKRVGRALLRYAIRAATGIWLTDPTSGFRAFGQRALCLLARERVFHYAEPEGIVAAVLSGLKVIEVPVTMRERASGRSYLAGGRAAVYMLAECLGIAAAALSRPPVSGKMEVSSR